MNCIYTVALLFFACQIFGGDDSFRGRKRIVPLVQEGNDGRMIVDPEAPPLRTSTLITPPPPPGLESKAIRDKAFTKAHRCGGCIGITCCICTNLLFPEACLPNVILSGVCGYVTAVKLYEYEVDKFDDVPEGEI